MESFDRAFAYAEIGTWNGSDDLDTFKLLQATDSSGTGAKDLTTSASGGNYDSDNPVDADGNFVIADIRAEDLDVDNSFTHIALTVAEGGNSGADNVTAFIVRHDPKYAAKELNGAASTGAQVYVTTAS
jgi:deoxycytidylate deaminase